MSLMNELEKNYNQTVLEFKNAPFDRETNLIRKNNFIQGLSKIIGSNHSIGNSHRYSYYRNDGIKVDIQLKDYDFVEDKQLMLEDIRDQIQEQLM